MTRIIYDFGAHNGNDIPYYLMNSDLVVAVEANPSLCRTIEKRFQAEKQNGRLAIENRVLTVDKELPEVAFYIHKKYLVLSQLSKPGYNREMKFEKVLLPSASVIDIIKKYGAPYYIKIDLEHYDSQILRSLFDNGIYPPFISAESHSIEVFSLLVCQGKYNAFKLVDGATVSQVYSDRQILNGKNEIPYSFPPHSAGPFGNDVDGKWMNANNFFRLLAFEGLGWKDIHATNQVEADPSALPSVREYFKRVAMNKIMNSTPRTLKRVIRKFS